MHAPHLDGGNMDDNTLAKLHVLFPTDSDYGECTNASVYFCNLPKVDSLTSHKLIAQQLIENKYLIAEQVQWKWPRRGEASHRLVALPTYRKFNKG